MKRKEGIINLDEQLELKRLINESASIEAIEACLDVLFDHRLTASGFTDEASVEKSLDAFNKKMENAGKVKKGSRWRLTGIAASIIFLTGIGLLVLLNYKGNTGSMQVVATTARSRTSLVLPDGSKVWINEKTELRFRNDFGRQNREVYLNGEAFFDVVKNKDKPFLVHTKEMDVKVLGTQFNVRAYKNECSSETTLIRGRVEVLINQKESEKVVLHPSEKLVIKNENRNNKTFTKEQHEALPEIAISKVQPNVIDSGFLETQWLKGHIHFDQQPLKDIIPMLEKWYGVKIILASPSLGAMRFSGKIYKETLGEVLESFKLSAGIQYRINNDTIIIR
ncbi:hypothetical protein A8C56_13845 [Niabella ginsenosidivorans]|uniref:Anti-sigma factor n=1 Tax=Niabella ginsenosidivorans TaxID=1176587 RepID=A0A1A9I5E5_9BACT|nr:hypothetical protein A8C56_13845 [Niabella ginsenosidivorans]